MPQHIYYNSLFEEIPDKKDFFLTELDVRGSIK